ncbi:polymorphic toxin-type HINT domain-containing protein [Streptomyces sp. NRRL S-87]|uniref:polymorphic toxin-type HINT domain-containing protein n=1 Tax=Streptomyces sp. NRRL S-87 TaxID=1463920 RepID=UPI00131CC2D3|nr:polymorphic toxin-type HINT domain-containing protein [Streptomyces sp. NRRL S-87]
MQAQLAKSKAATAAMAARARANKATAWPAPITFAPTLGARSSGLGQIVQVHSRATAKSDPSAATTALGTAAVKVLDQQAARKAGITGVLFTAVPQKPGPAVLTVDYSSFASAVGANWSAQLGLVSLPACALTTPQRPECRTATKLASRNNVRKQTVTADVTLAAPKRAAGPAGTKSTDLTGASSTEQAPVFAITADAAAPARGAGTSTATPLSASSTWEAGTSSGGFAWSYPIGLPPVAAGRTPSLSLSYNSSSIDGRTANTNNQGSQVGEGFDLTSSYIERKYGSCEDDGQGKNKFDLCWKYDNASLVLNGKATELVKDESDATGRKWRLKDDDASQVFHDTGADSTDDGDTTTDPNDKDGEYWRVITGDGTTYTFGLNKLPGAPDTDRTNSVWTVPVYGDDAGEPGYSKGATFSGRSVQQAWRWNLDLVQDLRGNASSYWYTKEGNYYAKNGDKTNLGSYTRGGYLKEIKYGQRTDALFTGIASGKVTFTYAERCFAASCSTLNEDTADNWPDVPFHAICSSTETDCQATGPSFFTRKRLTNIDTYVWSTDAEPDAFAPVDSYALTQEYLDGGDLGDTSDKSLTLKSLKHTPKHGAAIKVEPVDFTYQMRENRVDGARDNVVPLNRPRILTITSETGAVTTVTLSEASECTAGMAKPAEDQNTLPCYPVWWPVHGLGPELDWFHKYRVLEVSTADARGDSATAQTTYEYANPAWHYNDDPLTPEKERTWSNWRGYGKVTTYRGSTGTARTKTVQVFMQGMNGDRLKTTDAKTDTPRRAATVTPVDIDGSGPISITAWVDNDQYAGYLRQQVTYNGSVPIASTINNPYSDQTAVQHKSYADVESYYVRTQRIYQYTYLTATDSWRRTHTDFSFDSYGMPYRVSAAGDSNKTGDETCTLTWYARNPGIGLTNLTSRTRTVTGLCTDSAGALITDDKLDLPASLTTRGDVISDTATVYDDATVTGWTNGRIPTKGLPTWSGRAKAYPAASGTSARTPLEDGGWATTGTISYDALGRPVAVTNAAGDTTTTKYTPADKGPLTAQSVTGPKLATNGQQHAVYTYLDPAFGSITQSYDSNLKLTETTYDALGRVTATWLPNRNRDSGQSASATYTYSMGRDTNPWASQSTLRADGETYRTNYTISDSLLRPLQTQSPAAIKGRLLTDTRYDSRGLVVDSRADVYDADKDPDSTYDPVGIGESPVRTLTAYDGAARPTTSEFQVQGVKQWATNTSYTGDSIATTAVDGGNATRTITDALGRTTETRTYAGSNPDDTAYGATLGTAYTSVKQTYTTDGLPATNTGPDNTKWTYGYDLYGRLRTSSDPDRGTSTTHYTALDQISSVDDALGNTVLYDYDELGRKTGMWKSSRTDANKLAAWTYDSLLKGLPTASIRYEGGTTGDKYIKEVTEYDSMSRPITNRLTIPSDDPLVTSGAIKATTEYGLTYRLDGQVTQLFHPAAAGLATEVVGIGYNSYDLPTKVGGTSGYVSSVTYTEYGEPWATDLARSEAVGVAKARISNTYEAGTRRLHTTTISDETHPGPLQNLTYSYDQAGNVLSIADPASPISAADYQCFTYDGQRRLTESWTPKTNDCTAANRTTANLGGAAPYWKSYTYTPGGQRASETTHTATSTTNRTYCYDPARPHALTATTTGSSCTGLTPQYTYDDTGNTLKRLQTPSSTTSQTLNWNTEGKLSKVAEGTDTTTYVYDADGELLIRRNTGGDTVLYAGDTEVHLEGAKKWANRYYTVGGRRIAVRSSESGTSKVSFLGGDHHGTSNVSIDSSEDQTAAKRFITPFGAPRGDAVGTWPDDKRFLGKTADTDTVLTHVDAREYDPYTGQFISVDPILSLGQHQSLNGYAYAGNNPIAFSDPDGLWCDSCNSGKGWTRPDGGTDVNGKDDGGGYTDTGQIRGTGGKGSTKPTTKLEDLRNGAPGPLPEDLARQWLKKGYPSQAQMQATNGAAYEYLSQELNLELYYREQCTGAAGPSMGTCMKIRDFYDGWKHVKGIDTVETCPICENVGFQILMVHVSARMGGPCQKCFLAGTKVLLGDGSSKNIEEMKVGDTVKATDPITGKTANRRVQALIITEADRKFNALTLKTQHGIEHLSATYEHPFWSPSESEWIPARDLRPGMTLRVDDGRTVVITGNRPFTKRAKTYNLTVDDLHTYYVLAGETPVLVHNSSCGSADPFSFRRTEALSGNAAKRNVDTLTASMKENGWQGDPISVAKIGDNLYVLDGHHRVAAAKRAGVDVPYRILSDSEIRARYPGGADDITTAWAEVGPDKLVNKYRKPGYR